MVERGHGPAGGRQLSQSAGRGHANGLWWPASTTDLHLDRQVCPESVRLRTGIRDAFLTATERRLVAKQGQDGATES